MTDATTFDAKQMAANFAAQGVCNRLADLLALGLPFDAILAGAHAEIVAAMAGILGGEAAAASCERAANHVRDLPPAPALDSLAMIEPMGRA